MSLEPAPRSGVQAVEPNAIEQAMVILRNHIRALSDRMKPVCEEIPEGQPPSNESCPLLAQIQGADADVVKMLDTLQL